MLKEAIEQVTMLAEAAQEPKMPAIFEIKGQHHTTFTVDQDGHRLAYEHHRPPRAHRVDDTADLVGLADRLAKASGDSLPVFWIGDNAVTCVLNDAEYRDSIAYMPLVVAKPMQVLQSIGNGAMYRQQQFIHLLRTDLAKVQSDGMLLATVRKMKFTTGTQVEGEINQGRESMGKAITAEAVGAGDLPELVTLSMPVYDQLPHVKYLVEAVLIVDIVNGQFGFQVLPGEILLAYRQAQGYIRHELTEAMKNLGVEYPIYYGNP